ncbi:hypothetical protein FPANT_12706 [Fusarium pseudoanthophilum]|uniref:Uncharacterized protein n=1 Tax=Fusarium pseudoanthophilum TaxID=48495 RepID=A0A8H5KGU7_9HYPO|nr:hypothetical protein FPANT_12706 [Fusarium pseudoanthophilum]
MGFSNKSASSRNKQFKLFMMPLAERINFIHDLEPTSISTAKTSMRQSNSWAEQPSPPVTDSNLATTPEHAFEIPFRSANYRSKFNKDLILLLKFLGLFIGTCLAITSNLHNGVLPFVRGAWWTRIGSWLQG